MARQLLGTILAMVVSIFGAIAQDSLLIYDGITPTSGSEITSFNFTLRFDFSNVISEYGEAEYGIGWQGFHNDKLPTKEKSITIYKGEVAEGIVIGRCLTSNCTGSTASFKPSSELDISLDGIIPEPGVTYTMVITNDFKVYTKSSGSTSVTNTNFNCSTNPITYTFIGAQPSAERLLINGSSIESGTSLKYFSEISFTFSQPINVNSDVLMELSEGEDVIIKSNSYLISEDGLTVTYKFNNETLYNGHSYVLTLPSGAVCSSDNPSIVNDEFKIVVKGDKFTVFDLKASIPAPNEKTVFSTVEGKFDMPDGLQIYKKPQYYINFGATLYKNEVSEETLMGTLEGVYNTEKNGIIWTNTYTIEPEITYVLYKPEGEFQAYDPVSDSFSNDWYNGEVKIILNTPSIENSGLTPLELGAPVLGNHEKDPAFVEGQKVANITYLELALKDLKYEYNGHQNGMSIKDGAKFYVYNITSGEDVLVMEGNINDQVRETPLMYYKVASMSVFQQFFEGQKYKIVIPAGSLTVTDKLIQNYVFNQEWSIEFEGSTPTETKLNYCSLENNAELSELPVIIWEFQGDYVKNEELSAILHSTYTALGQSVESNTQRLTLVSNNLNTTKVAMVNYDSTTGKGLKLFTNNNRTYEVILPEGLIYYASDPSIKNPELRYNVIPVAATTPGVTNEFVNLEVTVNGLTTILQPAVKGESVTIKLTPNEDWAITSLTRNGDEVIELMEDGEYVTPKLTENNTIVAEISYGGTWAVETATNVWEIENGKIQIFAENNKIVVIGVTPDDDIKVFGVNGMLINSARVDNGNDRVMLSVSPGQVYIVVVDGKAAKLQM